MAASAFRQTAKARRPTIGSPLRPRTATASRQNASASGPTRSFVPRFVPPRRDEAGWTGTDTQPAMSAALDERRRKRLGMLLAQCTARDEPRRPAFERLREKRGSKLARVLVFALVGNQRRSARRG